MPPAIASLLAAITINDAMSAPLPVNDGKVAVGNSNRRATSTRSDNAAPVIICIVKAVGLGVPALAGSHDRAFLLAKGSFRLRWRRPRWDTVKRNGRKRDRDSGIELEESDRNFVDRNRFRGNADGLTDVIRCISGDDNVGSNMTRHCR